MKQFGKTFHISVIIVISLLVTDGKTETPSTTPATTSTTTQLPTAAQTTSISTTTSETLTTRNTRLIEVKYGRDYTAVCAEAMIFQWTGNLGLAYEDYQTIGFHAMFITILVGTLVAGVIMIITREEEEEELPTEDSEQGSKSTTSLSISKSTITSDEKSGQKTSTSSKKSIMDDAKPKHVENFVPADKSASFGVSRCASYGAIRGSTTPAKSPQEFVPFDLDNIDPKQLLADTKKQENVIIDEFMVKYGFDLTDPENRKIFLRKRYQMMNDNMEMAKKFREGERKGGVFIPREIQDMDMVPVGDDEEPAALQGVKFEEKKDEIYSIGTDVDDIELDADSSIGSSMNSSRAGSLRAHSHRKVSREPTQRKEKSKRNRMSREKKKERTLENSK